MANHSGKMDLDDFRRELEEDIQSFSVEKANKDVKKNSERPTEHHRSSSHHASNNISSHSSKKHTSSSHSSPSNHKRSSSHHSSDSHRRKKKTKRKPLKVVCILLAVIFLIAAGGYGFLQWELNRIERNAPDEITADEVKDNIDTEDIYGLGNSDSDLMYDPDITNILLIGQDRKEGQKAEMRSDAMIICSINSKTKEITLCSLMRDMYVPIPGYGYGMINHTYMIGGFDLLNKTIEKNFGIPIDGNIEVDFNRFMNLIDIMDGVYVNVTKEEAEYINTRNPGWNLTEGNNKLNSEQALYYCRIRKNIGGDWGRTDRQRKVIMSAFNQLKSSGAKTMVSFAHAAMPSLATNLTNTKLIKYAYAIVSYSMDANHSYRIPKEGTYTQEVREETLHVLIPDIRTNAKEIQKYLYEK